MSDNSSPVIRSSETQILDPKHLKKGMWVRYHFLGGSAILEIMEDPQKTTRDTWFVKTRLEYKTGTMIRLLSDMGIVPHPGNYWNSVAWTEKLNKETKMNEPIPSITKERPPRQDPNQIMSSKDLHPGMWVVVLDRFDPDYRQRMRIDSEPFEDEGSLWVACSYSGKVTLRRPASVADMGISQYTDQSWSNRHYTVPTNDPYESINTD